MLEVYRILYLALVEGSGRTKTGYRAKSLERDEEVTLTLSHESKPELTIVVRDALWPKVEVNFKADNGRNTTGTFNSARFAADAVLNL